MRTLELYSADQPRASDGKWKRWSGVSGVPGVTRTAMHRFEVPVDEEWLRDEGFDSPESFLSSWYEHPDLPGGTHAVVDAVVEDSWEASDPRPGYRSAFGFNVTGSFVKDGRAVGDFERNVIWDPSTRQLTVVHERLFLDASMQGQGIADAFNSNAVGMYQRYGVYQISTHAAGRQGGDAGNVGGYAWARQGFRVHPEEDRGPEIERMLRTAQQHLSAAAPHLGRDATSEVQREINVLRRASQDGEDVQPMHVAALGERVRKWDEVTSTEFEDKTYSTWVGKEAMLDTTWYGHFVIDPDAPITASSTSLAHVHVRPAYGASRTLVAALERRIGFPVYTDEDLACHDASCAPPPVGTGGSKGSGSGITADTLRGLFAFKGANGFETHVAESTERQRAVDALKRSITVEGRITKDGEDVGFFKRAVYVHDDGEIMVRHGVLRLDDPKAQGQGFAAEFYNHCVAEYRKIGVNRITLSTAEIGGYAWARQGFRIYPESDRKRWVSSFLTDAEYRLTSWGHQRRGTPEQRQELADQIAAMKNASSRGQDVNMVHVAALGARPEYPRSSDGHHLGKDILIGAHWAGYLPLDGKLMQDLKGTFVESS